MFIEIEEFPLIMQKKICQISLIDFNELQYLSELRLTTETTLKDICF